jgi:guanidinopropionase
LLRAQRRENAQGLDIALAGVPFDYGTYGRPGSRLGPAQVREYAWVARPINFMTGVEPFALCRIADVGDAPIRSLDTEGSVADIQRFFEEIVAVGASPLAVGGDHTISLPILRAVAKRPRGPVGLVHFDAHPDTHDASDGTRVNYATPFRRSAEEGLSDPKRHVMLGIRGMISARAPYDWARDQGITLLTADDVADAGPAAVVEKVRAVVGQGPVYITFDLDGLDPIYAPGTGMPEPGGLAMQDCQRILRGLRGLDIVGADVNEIAPPFDPSGLTAIVVNHLMFELLCLIAESRAAR